MFYHTEHHLFPKVPTCHLPQLAARIDEVIPEIKNKTVL
ncbi:MAG: fatty acid desaturase [Bacteroidetes bacterium]|nr:fatty acid desaturase [Bacteroidota bacterium]